MLISAAAQGWNVDPTSCRAEKGEVIHGPTGRKLSYGALADTAAALPVPDNGADVATVQTSSAQVHAAKAAGSAGSGQSLGLRVFEGACASCHSLAVLSYVTDRFGANTSAITPDGVAKRRQGR